MNVTMGNSKSALETFLDLLEVKTDGTFTGQHFNEHPYRYNLAPKPNADIKNLSLRQSRIRLKADEDVFRALLKKQPFYEDDCDSIIRFENPDSKIRLIITIKIYIK